MSVIACRQGSREWHEARAGKITASAASDIITKTGAARDDRTRESRLYRVVAESVAGRPFDDEYDASFARAVRLGTEREPMAADKFEREFHCKLKPSGFHVTADGRAGASLDRLIEGTGDKEAVEIKCPLSGTQAKYLCYEAPKYFYAEDNNGYYQQVQMQMYVGNLRAVHLYVFHPSLPSKRIITVRDDAFIARLHAVLQKFIGDVDAEVAKIREYEWSQ